MRMKRSSRVGRTAWGGRRVKAGMWRRQQRQICVEWRLLGMTVNMCGCGVCGVAVEAGGRCQLMEALVCVRGSDGGFV